MHASFTRLALLAAVAFTAAPVWAQSNAGTTPAKPAATSPAAKAAVPVAKPTAAEALRKTDAAAAQRSVPSDMKRESGCHGSKAEDA